MLIADGDAAALCLECQHDLMTHMKQLIIDGAEIRICQASLEARGESASGVPDYLPLVASGAVELARLQDSGWRYIRPGARPLPEGAPARRGRVHPPGRP